MSVTTAARLRQGLAHQLRLTSQHPSRLVVVAFGLFASAGTLLLWLPWSGAGGRSLGFMNALFTATSAVCVTGLAVVDTGSDWSAFGRLVILVLVQVGGLGIMTLASLVFLVLGNRIGVTARSLTATEAGVGAGDVRRVLLGVAASALIVELALTIVLTLRLFLSYDRAFVSALWEGVFNSVMTFNNAGFSLNADSFVPYATDWVICVPVMAGIVIGGLGFPVLVELTDRLVGPRRRRRTRVIDGDVAGPRPARIEPTRRPRLTLHSRLTLVMTLLLVVGGAVVFCVFEWTNQRTLGALPEVDRVLAGTFQSVTTRTTGFNSIDIGGLRAESVLVTSLLMFIGAGSASTGGGLKVTTLAILLMVGFSEVRGDEDINVARRRLPERTGRVALAVTVISIGVVGAVTTWMVAVDPFTLEASLFEAVSAFGTVGLSRGITPLLSVPAELAIIFLMFFGRVGPVTLAAAFAMRRRRISYRYPEERALVG